MAASKAKIALLLFLGASALVSSPADAAKTKDDERGVVWRHDWVPERLFDYRYKSWRRVNEGDFAAIFLRNETTYRYEAGGAQVTRWEFELAIRKPMAVSEYFVVARKSAHTQTEFTQLELSWTSGGTSRTFDEGDLSEQAHEPSSAYVSGDTSHTLLLDRSRPGTLRGLVETRDAPHKGFEQLMGGAALVQAAMTSKNRTIHIEVPQGTAMTFEERFFSLDGAPALTTADGFDRYTYRFQTLNRPGFEYDMPHWFDSYPAIFWSNQSSWEELAAMVDAVWEPELRANEAMSAWALELTEGLGSTHAKAVAIHDAIADGWGYLGFYPGQSGWTPHAAEECYAVRTGDCKDQTALMVALMRQVGIDAHPALVNSGRSFRLPSAPILGFNHAIVWIKDSDHAAGGFFLDSVDAGIGSSPVRSSLGDRQALVIDDVVGGLVEIPAPPAEHWLESDETLITLAEDGSGTAEVTWRFMGMAANRQSRDAAREERSTRERLWRDTLYARSPGSRILSIDEGPDPASPHDTWRVQATLHIPSAISIQGSHAIFHPPWLRKRSPTSVQVDKGHRTHPIVLAPLNRRSYIRIRLPPNLRVLALPEPGGETRDHWRSSLNASASEAEVLLELSVQEDPGPMPKGLQEARRNFVKATGDLQKRVLVMEVIQ